MTEGQIIFEKDNEEPQVKVIEEGFSRTFQLGISKLCLNKKLTENIKEHHNKVRVPGFRKGKAPISVIVNRLPEEEIENFLKGMVREQVDLHLSESDKIVLGTPEIDTDYSEETGLAAQLTMTYEICPNVPEIDFAEYKLVKFIPQDRVQLLQQIRVDLLTANPEKIVQEIGYKSEIGDIIKIDLSLEAPETDADGFMDRGREILVDENSDIFGEKFNSIGLAVDDEFTVDSKLPQFFEGYEFEGFHCKFQFKVLEIFKNVKLAEPTLAMAIKFGFSSVEELDEALLERKLQQFDSISTSILRNQFAYIMKSELNFDVPAKILNFTMEDIWHERKESAKNGKNDSTDANAEETDENDVQEGVSETETEEEFKVDWTTVDPAEVADIKALAIKRVRYLVLLKDIAKKENIKVSRDEILDEWSLHLSRHYKPEIYDPAKHRSELRFEDVPEHFVINTQQRITISKVETLIVDRVGKSEWKISFKQLWEYREKETFDNFQDFLISEGLVEESEPGKD